MGTRQLSNHHDLHLKHKEASRHAVGTQDLLVLWAVMSKSPSMLPSGTAQFGVWYFQQQETNLQLLLSKQKL